VRGALAPAVRARSSVLTCDPPEACRKTDIIPVTVQIIPGFLREAESEKPDGGQR